MTIQVTTRYIAPAEPTLPALGVQVTRLVDSYMIWVGMAGTAETVQDATRSGSLCKDWACATGEAATMLYGTSGSQVACSMAQRLAIRTGKTVFLSVDIPDSLQTRLLLVAEKGIIDELKS